MHFWLLLLTISSCLIATTFTAQQDSEVCPSPDMRRFRNSCVWAGNGIKSHHASEEDCKRRGGHLAMPKDFATQQFIKDLVHEGRYNSYWVGIREVEDSRWVFMDHSPLGNFTYWAPNEPSGAENEDCVLLAAHVQTKWVTTQCHWGYKFICQIVDACDVQDLSKFYNLRLKPESNKEQKKLFPVESRIEVECANGFVSLKGPKNLHCEIGGKWTNSTKCSKGCAAPNLPPTVRLLRSQPVYTVGENLALSCDTGHTLKGSLKCDNNGNWVGEAPTCIVINIPPKREAQVTCPKIANITQFGIQEPEHKFVPIGSSINLPCVRDVQSWPKGLWMKDQNLLEFGNTNIPSVEITNNGTLSIARMSSATEGLYTCIAFGSKREDKVNYHSVRLLIPRECNLRFDPPPSVHALSSTNFVLLRCQAHGAIMSWHRKDGQVLNDDNHILLANSALLVRRSVKTSGDYICRAEHANTHCRVERSVSLPIDGNIDELCGRPKTPAAVPTVTSSKTHGKLVGGHEAPKGSHPWIVIFSNIINNNEKFLCGGNLINHRWVASAAHCFFWVKNDKDIEGLKAKLGKYDRLTTEPGEKVVTLTKIILHPGFDTGLRSFNNDLALIRLSERVQFSDTIIPICLPKEGFVASFYNARHARVAQPSRSSGTVSGWGRLEEDGPQPKYLHQVRLPIVDYNVCKASTKQHVTENMFCAGYEQAVGDSCQGDSGGPFEMYQDEVAYLAGIVSWGEGCARPGTYGFYTKVENYRDFIEKETHDGWIY